MGTQTIGETGDDGCPGESCAVRQSLKHSESIFVGTTAGKSQDQVFAKRARDIHKAVCKMSMQALGDGEGFTLGASLEEGQAGGGLTGERRGF